MTQLTGANPDTDWREHEECDWTWPNSFGIVGCEEHSVVFLPPVGEDAWTVRPVITWSAA
jgi:hypothetical protein